jgi:hypothetical protein
VSQASQGTAAAGAAARSGPGGRRSRPGSRSPLAAIVGYTLGACVPARRALLLLPFAGGVVFGLLSRTVDGSPASAFLQVGGSGFNLLVLPITCLVLGDALLGAEIRSGVFAFTWLSPVHLRTIVVGRWVGGCLIAAAILAPAAAAAALLAGAPASAGPAVVAAVTGAGAYLAVFLAVGATFKRAVVWSLALVILVEHLLGAALAGVAQVAPGWLAQAVLVGLTDTADDLRRAGIPHGWAAVGRLAVVAGVGVAVAGWRLRHIRPASASD